MRRLATPAILAAAALAGWLLDRHGPWAEDDPFAGTLAVLPFAVAALVEIGRTGRRRGGRSGPAAARFGEGAALALLVAGVLSRHRLSVAHLDEILACGFVLLLAAHLARRLLELRPLLGRRLPARPPALFFFLPAVAYLALLPWSTHHRPPDGDEPWYLLVTHSLAYDLDAELSNNYAGEDWRRFIDRPLAPQPGDPEGPEGQRYSRHNALLPLLLALPYRLAGKAGALGGMALLTAALAWMVLRLGRRYAPERPGEVLAAYALVAFTPPLLLYSYQLWVEVPAALLAMVALDGILTLRARRQAARGPEPAHEGAAHRRPGPTAPAGRGTGEAWAVDGGPGGRWWPPWLTLAVALVLLPMLKIRFMLLAVPLLALAWWHAGRHWRPVVAVGLVLALVGGGILLHNQLRYDNPLKIHSWEEVDLHRYAPARYLEGFSGLFYDAAFGLFGCAPLWLLLLPAGALLVVRRHPLAADLAVFALPYLFIVAPRGEWYGGWSPPFRYALVALPLLGLGLAPLLAERRRAGARGLLAGLGVLTLVLTLLWIAVPGWTYSFADGRTYLLDHLSQRLGADVARLFPSYVRLRPASWIWPLATLALVPLLWWWPRRRTRRAALWGVTAALAAAAAVPVAAYRLPSRVIEVEDPQVVKTGGHLYPDRWVIARTRFRGGWVLREGERLTAPVAAGGGRARLAIEAQLVRNRPGTGRLPLQVWIGKERVATLRLDSPRPWHRYELEEVAWPEGAALTLRVPRARGRGYPGGIILDRVEIEWR